jgi:translation initiation factor 3 subunit D
MKIGYVSRKHPCASQITLSMNMCWGIFKKFVARFQNLPEGNYLILRDPHKPVVRLYILSHLEPLKKTTSSMTRNKEV